MAYNILVINPGATSTKIAWFKDNIDVFSKNIMHTPEELQEHLEKPKQIVYRKELILKLLQEEGFVLSELDAIACRGGTFEGLIGGAYIVDEALYERSIQPDATHPASWAAVIGKDIADEYGIKAYIYDAVGCDETNKIAKFTGIKGLWRKNRTHTLNTRAVCKKVAENLGIKYQDGNFIAVHMGGGLSINAHHDGRIIDTVATEEGPMSIERSGTISNLEMIELAYSGKFEKKELTSFLMNRSGLISHLGTNDMREVEKMIKNGDEYAKEVLEFWAYQIGKFVGAFATVLQGKIDQIVITGGAAHSKILTALIIERIEWIAPVTVIPGSLEMEALANGILGVLNGVEEAKKY